eukprot:CAMPEP_0197394746 /NCGR_PEP_ID=MMETSP1165-20131217/5954_1 /TAXON_ID=284809 /ORGANISM="Chrysocystis fragilis, Strain CCMP3189" /LENGTH=135 /DNA_ID=CAMNT_0042920479 /DNA_START=91 /DNA_END=498 /DNA_ORIENTATION=+
MAPKWTLLSVAVLVLAATEHAVRADSPARAQELESEEVAMAARSSTEEEKAQATERVNDLVDGIRRLQYSYDFDSNCVSSFAECVDDSNCGADEECFFAASRKKRKLEAANGEQRPGKLRSLLFGSNAVGQCVCL